MIKETNKLLEKNRESSNTSYKSCWDSRIVNLDGNDLRQLFDF